jgi:transposase
MAKIHRSRSKSGATMVRVIEYAGGGRERFLKYIGSAHTAADLAILMDRARDWLRENDPQGELDLGLKLSVPRVELVGPRLPPSLFSDPIPAAVLVPSGRVLSTKAQVLAELLVGVYSELGFDALSDRQFRDLVVAWVAGPRSIRKTGKTLRRLGLKSMSESTRRRALRRCQDLRYRDVLADLCFQQALTSGDISLCLYDVTTVATHAEKEDGLRRVGYSKSRSIDPQVVIGLLVDRRGFPLEIGVFEGNRAEKNTMIEIIEGFRSRHGIENMVVVADAGMLSAPNLKTLDENGFKFIVGARNTKAPHDLASHFRWHGDAFTNGQIIDTVTAKTRQVSVDNDVMRRREPVWDPVEMPRSWRAIWAFTAKRAVRDNQTLNKQEEKARAVVAGQRSPRNPRFVQGSGSSLKVNEQTLARARKVAGLKGYLANIPVTVMPASEVISSYHDLWEVERSFRMFKSDLKIAPIHVYSRESIEAHVTRAFAALAVAREVQYRTGKSIAHIVEELDELHHATIAINGTKQTYRPKPPKNNEH